MYSELVLEHFRNPRHVGCFDPHGVGVVTARLERAHQVVRMQCRIVGTGIVEVLFQALGNPVVIASCSWVTSSLWGKSVSCLGEITIPELVKVLGVRSVDRSSVLMVVEVVANLRKQVVGNGIKV